MSRKPTSIPNPHAPKEPPRKLDPLLGGRTVRRRDFLNGLLVGASGAFVGGSLLGCEGGGGGGEAPGKGDTPGYRERS